MSRRAERAFLRDLAAASREGPPPWASLLLLLVAGALVGLVYWASIAELDEVTSGMGQIVPSNRTQVIQNLEGGIVQAIHVQEGDIVKAGQALVTIDSTQFSSKYREERAKYLGHLAAAARMEAELADAEEISFPEAVLRDAPEIAANELRLRESRASELDSALSALENAAQQRREEITEIESRIVSLENQLSFGREEQNILAPMVRSGVTSRLELVRLNREIAAIQVELDGAHASLPRVRSALQEAEERINERRARFRTETRALLSETQISLAALEEVLQGQEDKIRRTEVTTPVAGIVNTVSITTLGGVIRPGMNIVEIVPLDDSLVVEARIRPSDIAFLRPGLPAVVKISAYDFAIYGGMDATLEQISPDTVETEDGTRFYVIRLRSEDRLAGKDGRDLPIIPGMQAEVDILTGKKTVLDYLLKPVLRGFSKALREP